MALTKIKTGSVSDSITLTTPTADRLGVGAAAHAAAAILITTTDQHLRLANGSELGVIDLDSDGKLNIWAHGDGETINLKTGSGVGTTAVSVVGTNVGIGTDSISQPSAGATTLKIKGTHNDKAGSIYLESANASVLAYIYPDSNNGLSINTSTSHPIIFRTVGAERMRINDTGVISWASAGTASLSSVNSHNVSGDVGIYQYLGSNCSNTSSVFFSGLISGTGNKIYIYGNGNIVNTNNSYGAISDLKLKENITDASPKLAELNKVRVVNYNFINDETKQLGVIAQELEAIFPAMIDETPDRESYDAVVLDADGSPVVDEDGNNVTEQKERLTGESTKSVKYSVFVPMLVKAMQEQQTLIEALTARIEILEGA